MQISDLLPLNQNSKTHGPVIIGLCQKVSTVVYRLINNGIFVHCLYMYRQKHGSC